MFSETSLDNFLRAAKANTYASGAPSQFNANDNSENYHYTDGGWTYHDRYWGTGKFIGHEIVCFDGKPVWGMNYYGGANNAEAGYAYTFLKKALLRQDERVIPIRGPEILVMDGLTYENKITGTLVDFTSIETVTDQKGTLLCMHRCAGGLIL